MVTLVIHLHLYHVPVIMFVLYKFYNLSCSHSVFVPFLKEILYPMFWIAKSGTVNNTLTEIYFYSLFCFHTPKITLFACLIFNQNLSKKIPKSRFVSMCSKPFATFCVQFSKILLESSSSSALITIINVQCTL